MAGSAARRGVPLLLLVGVAVQVVVLLAAWMSLGVLGAADTRGTLPLVRVRPTLVVRDDDDSSLSTCPAATPCPHAEEEECDGEAVQELLVRYHEVSAAYKQHNIAHKEPHNAQLHKRQPRFEDVPCGAPADRQLTIAAFNLWNVNEDWRERVRMLARELDGVDVLALQEVRSFGGGGRTAELLRVHRFERDGESSAWLQECQLGYVAEVLTQFPHATYGAAARVQDQVEGLAILSRFPIADVSMTPLVTMQRSSDLNTRAALHARIDAGDGLLVDVVNTHLTYDDRLQCFMVPVLASVAQSVRDANPDPSSTTVLLGDMNTYIDFEWPMDFLTVEPDAWQAAPYNPCARAFSWFRRRPRFVDAWHEAYPRGEDGLVLAGDSLADEIAAIGHTFPSFEHDRPIDDCRPDRILVTKPCPAGRFDSACGRCTVCTTALFADQPYQGSAMLSDHRGLKTRISCTLPPAA